MVTSTDMGVISLESHVNNLIRSKSQNRVTFIGVVLASWWSSRTTPGGLFIGSNRNTINSMKCYVQTFIWEPLTVHNLCYDSKVRGEPSNKNIALLFVSKQEWDLEQIMYPFIKSFLPLCFFPLMPKSLWKQLPMHQMASFLYSSNIFWPIIDASSESISIC